MRCDVRALPACLQLSGTTERPRLAIFKSNEHMYAQVRRVRRPPNGLQGWAGAAGGVQPGSCAAGELPGSHSRARRTSALAPAAAGDTAASHPQAGACWVPFTGSGVVWAQGAPPGCRAAADTGTGTSDSEHWPPLHVSPGTAACARAPRASGAYAGGGSKAPGHGLARNAPDAASPCRMLRAARHVPRVGD